MQPLLLLSFPSEHPPCRAPEIVLVQCLAPKAWSVLLCAPSPKHFAKSLEGSIDADGTAPGHVLRLLKPLALLLRT
jgi:hypothetical protein